MLGLPKLTQTNKQLPKKAIYQKFNMNTATKEKFDADISRISIINEITSNNVNISAGDKVKNFFVLLVILKNKEFDEKSISILSKLIPQNIIFVLEFDGQQKLAIYHNKLIQSEWKKSEELSISLDGLNLDTVWENIVKDIGNITVTDGNTLAEQIIVNEQIEKIKKEIARLEKQARAEKQPNKKFELVKKIQLLKNQMEI